MKVRIISILILVVVGLLLIVTGPWELISVGNPTLKPPKSTSWAIYWYLCGSDLETDCGYATDDLLEMVSVDLPDDVNVVIQTGGTEVWQNNLMSSSEIQRWLYSGNDLLLVDSQESANMGDAQTLCDFLTFANENYPAEKVAVIFWNHGGGSVSGAAFDELYDSDSLDLAEMYQAFDAV